MKRKITIKITVFTGERMSSRVIAKALEEFASSEEFRDGSFESGQSVEFHNESQGCKGEIVVEWKSKRYPENLT